mmetsp:Transcript_5929/g.14064  ORF Transcript_5929/g.14064 Transcript_5929/m.14064 type:complete len:449 (+) Transcript_5929:87-1433(+)
MIPLELRLDRGKQQEDDLSWCSTRSPSNESSSRCPQLWTDQEAFNKRTRYVLFNEVLGGGMKGVVQKGYDSETGKVVAVKRIQCDKDCQVRFVEIQQYGSDEVLSAEGYAPVDSEATSWSGRLVHDSSNAHAAVAFSHESLAKCIVIVRRGGGVSFLEKLLNAQRGGAVGVLIVNNEDRAEVYSVGEAEPPLPSVMVTRSDGDVAIHAALACQASNTDSEPSRFGALVSVFTDVQHELAICRRLPPHPQVARVFDAWQDGPSAVLIMEFCRGGKASVSTRSTQGLAVALWLIKQMLEGVAHLHAHGICHRDLKPENMLLTKPLEESGARLVLVDFSMASTAQRMRVPCGSPRYVAPEVLVGNGYDLPRDLWSVGMVAHELVFRQHPFDTLSDHEVIRRLSVGDLPVVQARADVPQAVCELIGNLLQAEPAARWSAREALEHFREIALP